MIAQEINSALHQTITPYVAALEVYTQEQFSHKEANDIWSLGEMYEHLVLSANFFFLANTLRCLEKRKGQEGGRMNAYGENAMKYNSLPPGKFKVPASEKTPPLVVQDMADCNTLLQKILTDADALQAPVAADAGTYKCLHPVFGFLNAIEWYQMLEMHHRHHHRQKAELEAFAGVGI